MSATAGKYVRGKPGRQANALRHGRHALTLGLLPPGFAYITRSVNALRTQLESSVLNLRGEITLTEAAAIQSCCRWERHAQLASRWLKINPDLPVSTKLELSRDIAKASESRDRHLRLLKLDATPEAAGWAVLRSPLSGIKPLPTDRVAGLSDGEGGTE